MSENDTILYYIRKKYLNGNKFQVAVPRTRNDLFVSKYGVGFLEAPGMKTFIQNFRGSKKIPLSRNPITNSHYLAMCEVGVPSCRVVNIRYLMANKGQTYYCKDNSGMFTNDYFGFDSFELFISGGYINQNSGILKNMENRATTLAGEYKSETFHNLEELNNFFEDKFKDFDEAYIVSSKYGVIFASLFGEQAINNNMSLIDFFKKELAGDGENKFYTIGIKTGIDMSISVNTLAMDKGTINLETANIDPDKTYKRFNLSQYYTKDDGEVILDYNPDVKETIIQTLKRKFTK